MEDKQIQIFNLILINLLVFSSTYLLIRYGWDMTRRFARRQAMRYDTVLNKQLLMDVNPYQALGLAGAGIVFMAIITAMLGGNWFYGLVGGAIGFFIPQVVISHIEAKRKKKLEEQLIDGIMSLSSGVRAGLTLVQSMELLVQNQRGPIKQEFEQLLREYHLGIDLHKCMNNCTDRIGLSNYRLMFAAIEAHRTRGGNMALSLDRIADAVREIQRLEGKLQTLTAQGRNEATMMALMPMVILGIMFFIVPEDTTRLFTEPLGRMILLAAAVAIMVSFFWIRKIMSIEI